MDDLTQRLRGLTVYTLDGQYDDWAMSHPTDPSKNEWDGQWVKADEAAARIEALEAEVARLRDGVRLIELIGYREGEDFGWINAHMRGVATSILSGESIAHYWRLFPNHRPRAALPSPPSPNPHSQMHQHHGHHQRGDDQQQDRQRADGVD